MTILPTSLVSGDRISLQRLHPQHLNGEGRAAPLDTTTKKGFDAYLLEAMNGVNDLQNRGNELSIQALTDPDSVDPQDVTIALSEATLALNITRTVFDRALQAYNGIMNMR